MSNLKETGININSNNIYKTSLIDFHNEMLKPVVKTGTCLWKSFQLQNIADS